MSSAFLRQLYQIFAVLCIRFLWHAFKQPLLVVASSPAHHLSGCFCASPCYFGMSNFAFLKSIFLILLLFPLFLKVWCHLFSHSPNAIFDFNKFSPAVVRSNCDPPTMFRHKAVTKTYIWTPDDCTLFQQRIRPIKSPNIKDGSVISPGRLLPVPPPNCRITQQPMLHAPLPFILQPQTSINEHFTSCWTSENAQTFLFTCPTWNKLSFTMPRS